MYRLVQHDKTSGSKVVFSESGLLYPAVWGLQQVLADSRADYSESSLHNFFKCYLLSIPGFYLSAFNAIRATRIFLGVADLAHFHIRVGQPGKRFGVPGDWLACHHRQLQASCNKWNEVLESLKPSSTVIGYSVCASHSWRASFWNPRRPLSLADCADLIEIEDYLRVAARDKCPVVGPTVEVG